MTITKLMEGLPNQAMSQADFDQAAGEYMADLPAWGAEVNATKDDMNALAAAADASADIASTKAGEASASAGVASTQAGIATAQAGIATTKADEASDSAAAAADSAAAITATSTTSLPLTNGTKILNVGAGKQFASNQPIVIANASGRMFGTVTTYASPTLTASITSVEGTAGTYSDWIVAPSGAAGPTGGTAGGTLTDALNEKKGTSPASSATPDIWNAGGNYIPIIQTADITDFPNAPQSGARRNLFIINPLTIVSGANLVVRGGTRTLQPGDEVEIVADTVSTFHATIKRGTGLPVSSLSFLRADLYLAAATSVARVSGPHRAILVGSGGSGARVGSAASVTSTASATGGAAGGLAIKDYDAAAGDSYSYLPGAPGAAPSGNANGNAGSPSTFSGPNVSLTVNGGGGGFQSSTSASTVPGAVGGTASGGDFNFQGGDSGACAANKRTSGTPASVQATGGGAVSWSGTRTKSGDVESASANGASYLASGGASIAYNSGDVKPSSGAVTSSSGGAGTAGPSPNVTATTSTVGANGPGKAGLNISPINLIGTGAGASSGAGGGSPGVAGVDVTSADAGALAGSGAVALTAGSTAGTVGAPGWGAGSGGGAAGNSSTITIASGGISILIILS